ncbi:MAG: histidine phosphatase family protein [Candidatus Thermoplasmatota archaeon]|jgi:phosphohistidine phosphatase SixA|nr:histidine phosphatase family protein [Candidatus Sysuiplasma jiujiangense]MBX8641902.1 histidine phosphatase family protein [Candidatus Sysuiplasma jiujiangense]MCL5253276.1 histidine phosphatase family protein [Candidatus Thermoplasmatota archaeon]
MQIKLDEFSLYLVRHGEPDAGVSGPDPPLSEHGRAQIENASKLIRMHSERIAAIASSPLSRAVMSARILASAFNIGFDVEERLEPEGDAGSFLPLFLSLNNGDKILVGHIPSLRSIISYLSGAAAPSRISIPGGGVVCLRIHREDAVFIGEIEWAVRTQ